MRLRARFYSGSESGAIGMVVLALLVTALLWGHTPQQNLVVWLVAMLAAVALWLLLKYVKLSFHAWRYIAYPTEALHGLLWGSVSAFLVPADPMLQGIVAAVSIGMLISGSVSSSQFLVGFFCYTTPLVGLSSYGYLNSPLDGATNYVLITLIAWGYGSGVAVDQRRLHLELVSTALENEKLVGELTHERTQLVAANDRLEVAAIDAVRMARTDPLTGLANRRSFNEHLSEALDRLASGQIHQVSLAYLDLDGFKQVNDQQGHRAGDQLLVCIARRLTEVAVEDDLVARLGGDELVIIGVDSTPAALGRRVSQVFQAPVALGSKTLDVTASIGVAATTVIVSGDDLIKQADDAQYKAKRSGDGRIVFADEPTIIPLRASPAEPSAG